MKPFFFKSKPKTPSELVKALRESLAKLIDSQSDNKKTNEDISKILSTMKLMLYGDGESEPNAELGKQLSSELVQSSTSDVLMHLLKKLALLEFEAKKDVAQIFNNLLKRQAGKQYPVADYFIMHPELLDDLVSGYDNQDISLNSGMILRECIRHEALAKIVLESQQFFRFFEFVELSSFDVASDAFATFKDLLTKHKALVIGFLEAEYDQFFKAYTGLINSSNYVTKRQSLKLLGELLLDRTNFVILTKYIANPENLKLIMNLLKEKSRNIQFEAFHVFKIFVANPSKAKPILDILQKNKEKLISYLTNFHNDRSDDDQFNDEKTFLITQIQAL